MIVSSAISLSKPAREAASFFLFTEEKPRIKNADRPISRSK